MNKRTQFVTCSLLLLIAGCGPKVTDCVVDFPIGKAHCVNLDNDQKFDKSLQEMDKYECLSPDDFSSLLRGNGKNISVCAIVSAHDNNVYCNTPSGSIATTLEGIHKFACFTADDLSTLLRYVQKKK